MKLDELYRQGRVYNGRRVLDESFVREATRAQSGDLPGFDYGYLWWVTPIGSTPAYSAIGLYGQLVLVVPSRELVVAISNGSSPPSPSPEGQLLMVETEILVIGSRPSRATAAALTSWAATPHIRQPPSIGTSGLAALPRSVTRGGGISIAGADRAVLSFRSWAYAVRRSARLPGIKCARACGLQVRAGGRTVIVTRDGRRFCKHHGDRLPAYLRRGPRKLKTDEQLQEASS